MKKSAIMIAILIILIFVSGCVQAPMNDIQIDKDLENLVTSTENSTAESNKSQAKNINNPPHLDPIGDKTINEESTLIFRISASDSDNNTLIYSVSNLPTGATFDTVTQTFSWKPSQAKGSYHVIFTVTDGILYDSESIIITAIQPAGTEIKHIKNTSISGKINENQIWSGDILITGDTHISGDLTILPGTTISFVVGDDVGWGNEIAPDGYNDLDPTRLKSYETTHSDLSVTGKLIAKGTPDKKIRFTSAAAKPDYADWVGIHVGADNSIMEYCIIEWSRHGIGLGNNIPNTIIQNNIINYTFWGSISSGHSSAQIYNNEIWESGHEGIDVQGGNPLIENNKIYNAHTGIVVLSGSAIIKNNRMINVGSEIYVASGATPVLENNHGELAPNDSEMEWSYGNFSYVTFGNAVIK